MRLRLFSYLFSACLATQGIAQDETILRYQVRLVHVLVTAKDASGKLVSDLNRDDFTVNDNGVPQKISVFERETGQPLSVSLLIDNSGSTARDLKFEVDSISRFVRTLFERGGDQDRAALYSFNYQVVKQTGFTNQPAPIERALRGLRGEAGTSLYDALYLAGGELFGRPGRRIIVIVTDGADTTSYKDFKAAVEAAQRSDAIIYPVLIVPIENEAGRSVGGENALITLAANTGGRVFVPTIGASLDRAFADIVRELRSQYYLGYYPKDVLPTRDGWHRIKVDVRRTGLQVSARTGYYGDSTAASPGTARIFAAPN